LEAVGAAADLGVGNDGLDDRLALAVERLAVGAAQDGAHEVVKAALSEAAGGFAGVGVGANEDLHPARDQGVDVGAVPVARVGEDDPERFGDAGLFELAGGGGDSELLVGAVG
jgi:hypothetical protein